MRHFSERWNFDRNIEARLAVMLEAPHADDVPFLAAAVRFWRERDRQASRHVLELQAVVEALKVRVAELLGEDQGAKDGNANDHGS